MPFGRHKESAMIRKKILVADRLRTVDGGFSFIPHRFLTGGFLSTLDPAQLLLYFFLVLCGDRHGLSFYSYDKICTLLQMSPDQYTEARDALMAKDLLAFDGTVYQVLSLPQRPVAPSPASRRGRTRPSDLEPFGQIVQAVFKARRDG
jgi:hypothetical protein